MVYPSFINSQELTYIANKLLFHLFCLRLITVLCTETVFLDLRSTVPNYKSLSNTLCTPLIIPIKRQSNKYIIHKCEHG